MRLSHFWVILSSLKPSPQTLVSSTVLTLDSMVVCGWIARGTSSINKVELGNKSVRLIPGKAH